MALSVVLTKLEVTQASEDNPAFATWALSSGSWN